MRLPRNRILAGDALTRLRELPSNSVHACICSPPYYRLRDYGVTGQLGQEATVREYVANLRAVLQQVARVLHPAGSLILNLGDSFARSDAAGVPRKSLVLAPERVLLGLVDGGPWRARGKLIWSKTNPMPQSATDRLSQTYEVVYHLTLKSSGYFFDLDRIRVPHTSADRTGRRARQITTGDRENSGLARLKAQGKVGHALGRNPGDVWRIGKTGYRGEHSATFPAALIEPLVVATTPERICTRCGAGWRRPVVRPVTASRPAKLGPLTGCACRSRRLRRSIVLDPFLGTGTTAEVAARHGRDWIVIELNGRYRTLARRRLASFDASNRRGMIVANSTIYADEAAPPVRPLSRPQPPRAGTVDRRTRANGRDRQEQHPPLGGRGGASGSGVDRAAGARSGGRL